MKRIDQILLKVKQEAGADKRAGAIVVFSEGGKWGVATTLTASNGSTQDFRELYSSREEAITGAENMAEQCKGKLDPVILIDDM